MAEDPASSVAAPGANDGSDDDTSATDYYCQVCCEDVQGREAEAARFALSACRHCFCRDCLVGYLSSKVTEGDIAPRCFWSASSSSLLLQTGRHDTEAPPAAPRCREPISEADVEALLLREHPLLWAKFERYRFFKLSPSARECPKCSHRQCGDPLRPVMVCGQGLDGEGEGGGGAEAEEKGGGGEGAGCGYEYCFLHAGAHSGLTCAQYEAREQEEISQSRGAPSLLLPSPFTTPSALLTHLSKLFLRPPPPPQPSSTRAPSPAPCAACPSPRTAAATTSSAPSAAPPSAGCVARRSRTPCFPRTSSGGTPTAARTCR